MSGPRNDGLARTALRAARAAARRLVAFAAMHRKPGVLAVFNYHQITPVFDPDRHHRWTWTSLDDFDAQLDAITSRFEVVGLPEALDRLESGDLDRPCAAITLDDGDISVERHVVPLLTLRGIPATFFVNDGYWSGRPLHWSQPAFRAAAGQSDDDEVFWALRTTQDPHEYRALCEQMEARRLACPDPAEILVSRSFLEGLDPALFSVGLHGHEHQRFAMMPERWQREGLEANAAALSGLPAYHPMFAPPFGRPHDWNEITARICEQMGLALVLAAGGVNRPGQRYCERISADAADPIRLFRYFLVGW